MVCGSSTLEKTEGGKENTTAIANLAETPRIAIAIVKLHYLFLSPLILLTVPSPAILGLNIPLAILVGATGLGGNVLGRKQFSILASYGLLGLLIWGRVAQDLLNIRPPDTAFLLMEFGLVIFLSEVNLTTLTFDRSYRRIREREDPISQELQGRLISWIRRQMSLQGRISIGSLGLSLILLPVAGLTGIGSEQLPLTAGLLLVGVIALLFLVTYKREPVKKD